MSSTNIDLMPINRNFVFSGDVTQSSIGQLSTALLNVMCNDIELEKLYPTLLNVQYTAAPINIFIDSYGGELHASLGIVGIIDASTTPVHTIVTGCAMSAGFFIAAAGHKRFCYPNSSYMWHNLSYESGGDVESMRQQQEESEQLQTVMDKIVIAKTKITKKELAKIRKEKLDYSFDAQAALGYGVVDEIIKSQRQIYGG